MIHFKTASAALSEHLQLSINDLTIQPDQSWAFIGSNGSGKSALASVFTQDLAQELDVTARAMDLVTEYAREGKDGDINVSNQAARGVMGRLGLSGEKPLRKVGELSGGEKARVALSMFALMIS